MFRQSPTGAVGIIDGDFLNLNPAGIQDDDPFAKVEEEVNTDGTDPLGPHDAVPVRALNWKDPKGQGLETDLLGTPPFRVSAPIITDPCVATLRVRIAVANWCEREANEANDAAKNEDNDRADWWFPVGTGSTNFVDPDILQEDFWTTLTVANPNANQCPGQTREVAVQPSGADIDKYLPYVPFTADPAPY